MNPIFLPLTRNEAGDTGVLILPETAAHIVALAGEYRVQQMSEPTPGSGCIQLERRYFKAMEQERDALRARVAELEEALSETHKKFARAAGAAMKAHDEVAALKATIADAHSALPSNIPFKDGTLAARILFVLARSELFPPNATIQTAPSGARLQSLVGCEQSTGDKS
jgi:hypothetical protein